MKNLPQHRNTILHQNGVAKRTELLHRIAKTNHCIINSPGRFPLGDDFLIGCADGVGSKINVAVEMRKHNTIGVDLVAMNANNLITCGAKPLFFLDYFAIGQLNVEVVEEVIKGIMHGCAQAGCVLLGGDTTELPNILEDNEYDIGGFMIGIVPQRSHIDGRTINKGDVLVGLPSNGIHCNGFSVVTNILQANKISLDDKTPYEPALSFGDELLKPTKVYVNDIKLLQDNDINIKGIAHIASGGLIGNIQQTFKRENIGAYIDAKSWEPPQIFKWIKNSSGMSCRDMCDVFNMGIGMVIVVSEHLVEDVCNILPHAKLIGEVWNKPGVIIIP